jgi:post-segregation antitoxin (ccd killing protein)
MTHADGMAVDRLSVTVPSELGSALRALAKARGGNVSSVVTDAIAREVRLAALDRALAAADDRFGPLDEELVARAEVELAKAAKPGKRARRLKPR